jgi:hypothetical protein
MKSKKPWLSKTVWFNALVGLLAFWPTGSAWAAANTPTVLMGIGIVGMILRAVTKGKVAISE